jgi:hypothetical protein
VLRGVERQVRVVCECVEQRDVEYVRFEESGEHDRPTADALGQDAEVHQKRGSQEQGAGDEKVGRHRLDRA